ncbi:hypothetical protein [uncultured Stenotrophomonas sp.]|uniref:M949_RS01915 family surface polysaccharide biosynthesis protein n=1 Tax=uncultured Stenotrophomonas sp. TaxID=165438 RepID=UPI0028E9F2BA|nr:hypothetical protein [uncultured Stenotrophomonas sp.]
MHTRLPATGLIGLLRPALLGSACAALSACDDAAPAAQLPGLTMLSAQEVVADPMPGSNDALRRIHYRDLHGEGVLVLERSDEVIEDPAGTSTLDVAILTARLYIRPAPRMGWTKQWQRQIRQPCAGPILEAGWLLQHVGATDLDGDGQAEITLASHTFCGGRSDPHQLHVSLIDGSTSYGIEGETRLDAAGQARFDGERHESPSLAMAPPVFVQHLGTLWSALGATSSTHARQAH